MNNMEPAFPVQDCSKYQATGMTLRDYFAAKAMQEMVNDPQAVGNLSKMAEWSYAIADAMMKQREVQL